MTEERVERVARAICRAQGPMSNSCLCDACTCWPEHLDEAEAAIAAADEWQPIETAPKDGTLVLLCWDGKTRVGKYVDSFEVDGVVCEWNCWVVAIGKRPYSAEPDGWQPFPNPPEEG